MSSSSGSISNSTSAAPAASSSSKANPKSVAKFLSVAYPSADCRRPKPEDEENCKSSCSILSKIPKIETSEPFRLHLKIDPDELPFETSGEYKNREEVYVDLSDFEDECAPGTYAGTIVDIDDELGLFEVTLATGFVVLVPERVLRKKHLETWRKNGISSQLAPGVPVFVSMSGAETYFSAETVAKVERDQFEFPTSEMWTVRVQCDDDVVESPLRWMLCRSPVDERFSMDNMPKKGSGGDLYVGSPVFARPSRMALDEFITTESNGDNKEASDEGDESDAEANTAKEYYGRWLAGTVVGIGCHPALRRPWDQGRYLVKFSFEPMLCYVAGSNIMKRSSEDVAEGEWIPHALGDIVFADDPSSDCARAARIVKIDPHNGYRMSLYFPHRNLKVDGYQPYQTQQPKLRVPKFCLKAPRAFSEAELAGRKSCSLTSVYNLERLLLRCLLEEEGWIYVPQEPVSCHKRSKASGMDATWRPIAGTKVSYTSNSEYSDTVSHLDNTECISDKGTIAKMLKAFHITPPTWLYEEQALVHPPISHMHPDFFEVGSTAREVLVQRWSTTEAQALRAKAMQGDFADLEDEVPCGSPQPLPGAKPQPTGLSPPAQSKAQCKDLNAEQVVAGLRKDTVWFCKPAGRDYGGGMILGNSIEDCLQSPNFDKEDTYVLQPHILRPQLSEDGKKFGVRLYLLIVNDDDDRKSLRAYTHTTAGYVALGEDRKWDPLDTNKKLQLTHTGRGFENELDKWPLYEKLFPKMARQLAILFREAKHHLSCDSSKRCFELFGCDFVVDQDLQPWFLEVNTGPLLNQKQYAMLCDTARIVFYNKPASANLWQRLDTLPDDDGAADRAAKLKQDLDDLKERCDARFEAMLQEVGGN